MDATTNPAFFSEDWPWFLAEGNDDGLPRLFRGRQVPKSLIGDPTLPFLFVIALRYEASDASRLPTAEQYARLDAIERLTLERIESQKLGLTLFTETCDEKVRYFLYVNNVENSLAAMDDVSQMADLEFAAASDPTWSEYRRFAQGSGMR